MVLSSRVDGCPGFNTNDAVLASFFALVHVFDVRCSRYVCAFVRSKGVSVDRSRYVVVLGVRIVDGRRTKV